MQRVLLLRLGGASQYRVRDREYPDTEVVDRHVKKKLSRKARLRRKGLVVGCGGLWEGKQHHRRTLEGHGRRVFATQGRTVVCLPLEPRVAKLKPSLGVEAVGCQRTNNNIQRCRACPSMRSEAFWTCGSLWTMLWRDVPRSATSPAHVGRPPQPGCERITKLHI